MRMRSVRVAWLLAACLPVAVAVAQSKGQPKEESRPNFSGTWVMSPEKSEWGGVKPPDSLRYVIRHNGGSLLLTSTQDGVTTKLDVTTDGQERVTQEDADGEILMRLYWDEKTLVWEGRRRAKPARQVDPASWTSRWGLSEDGKVLTIQREITVVQGTIKQSVLLEKK